MRTYDWLGYALLKSRHVSKQNPWHDREGKFARRGESYMHVGHGDEGRLALVEPGGAISDRLFSDEDLNRLKDLKDDDGQPTTSARIAQRMLAERQQEGWEERERAYAAAVREANPLEATTAEELTIVTPGETQGETLLVGEPEAEAAPSEEEREEEEAPPAGDYFSLPLETRNEFAGLVDSLYYSTRDIRQTADVAQRLEAQNPGIFDEFPYTKIRLSANNSLRELAGGSLLDDVANFIYREDTKIQHGDYANDPEGLRAFTERYDELNEQVNGALDVYYFHWRDAAERMLAKFDAGETNVQYFSSTSDLPADTQESYRYYRDMISSSETLNADDVRDAISFFDEAASQYPGVISSGIFLTAERRLARAVRPESVAVSALPSLSADAEQLLEELSQRDVLGEVEDRTKDAHLETTNAERAAQDMGLDPTLRGYRAELRRIQQALRELGPTPTKAALENIYAYDAPGHTTHIGYRLVSGDNPNLYYTVSIQNSEGEEVMHMSRHYFKDRVDAHLNTARDEYKDKMVNAHMLAKEGDMVVKNGRKEMRCHANIDRGGYMWGHIGFDFESHYERENVTQNFQQGLGYLVTTLESVMSAKGKSREEIAAEVTPLRQTIDSLFAVDPQTGRPPLYHAWDFSDLVITLPQDYRDDIVAALEPHTKSRARHYGQNLEEHLRGSLKNGLIGRYMTYGSSWGARLDLTPDTPGRKRFDDMLARTLEPLRKREERQRRHRLQWRPAKPASPQAEMPEEKSPQPVQASLDGVFSVKKDLFGKEVVDERPRQKRQAADFLFPGLIDAEQAWAMENLGGDKQLAIDISIGPDGKLKVERKTLREAAGPFRQRMEEEGEQGLF